MEQPVDFPNVPRGWPNAGTKDVFQMMVASGRKWATAARQLGRKKRMAEECEDVKLILILSSCFKM